jgi:hypothetical protein
MSAPFWGIHLMHIVCGILDVDELRHGLDMLQATRVPVTCTHSGIRVEVGQVRNVGDPCADGRGVRLISGETIARCRVHESQSSTCIRHRCGHPALTR